MLLSILEMMAWEWTEMLGFVSSATEVKVAMAKVRPLCKINDGKEKE